MDTVTARLLRSSLGFVYLWFGALKLVGMSPVTDLVRKSHPPLGTMPLSLGLAVFEVTLGLVLLLGRWRRQAAAAALLFDRVQGRPNRLLVFGFQGKESSQ